MKNTKNIAGTVLLITAVLLLPQSVLKAQETGASQPSRTDNGNYPKGEVGVRFLPTFTKFQLTDAGGGKIKGVFAFGYGFAGIAGVHFTDHIGIQGEILYSALAQKYKDQGREGTIKLRYINIPMLVSLNTGKSRLVNLNVVAGPQIGINVGADGKTSSEGGVETVEAVVAVKRGDLGVAYGAGLDFGRKLKFNLGFRGVYGLIDISDKSKSQTTNEYYILDRAHVKTYSGYAGISYLF